MRQNPSGLSGGFRGLSVRAERAERLYKYPITAGIPYQTVLKVMKILGFLSAMSLPGEKIQQGEGNKSYQQPVKMEVQLILAGKIDSSLSTESK